MKDTELYRALKTLKPAELRDFRRYLSSPLFNEEIMYVSFIDLMVTKKGTLFKTDIDDDIFIQRKRIKSIRSKKDLYNCRTKILYHLENFILHNAGQKNPIANHLNLAEYYRKHGLKVRYDRAMRDAEKLLEKEAKKDSSYLFNAYMWQKISFDNFDQNVRRTDNRHLEAVSWALDKYYLSEKLMYSAEMINRSAMLGTEYEELIKHSVLPNAIDHRLPIIVNLHIAVIKLFGKPDELEPYLAYCELLRQIKFTLTNEEKSGFYLYAFNHCTRRINIKDSRFERHFMELINQMHAEDLLVINKVINPWVYKNIIQFFLSSSQPDRAVTFWDAYSPNLPQSHKETVSVLAKAQIALAQKDYNKVFSMTREVRHIDHHLVVSLKLLACKAYLQLEDFVQFDFHLEAFTKYLQYHKSQIDKDRIPRIKQFLSFCRRLKNVPPKDEDSLEEILKDIENTPQVLDAAWLTDYVNQKLSRIRKRNRR